jgi:hypothetical protein
MSHLAYTYIHANAAMINAIVRDKALSSVFKELVLLLGFMMAHTICAEFWM